MSRPLGPEKPPRSSPAAGGEEGRTLWQINWNDQEDEPVVTMVDLSKIELSEGDSFNPHVRVDEDTGDLVVFERNAQELEGKLTTSGSIYKKGKKSIDLSSTKSMVGQRYLVRSRSDSDLELYPPSQRRFELCARARWCCLSCRTYAFWKQYWWIPTAIFLAALLYILVVMVIMKTLLSW